MDGFDPGPYLNHPIVWTIGLISAIILMLKGVLVLLTELIRMLPPLITSIIDCFNLMRGPKGDTGDKGAKGDKGDKGEKGDKGAKD